MRSKMKHFGAALALFAVGAMSFAQEGVPKPPQERGSSATAPVRPSGLYGEQLGVASREKLTKKLNRAIDKKRDRLRFSPDRLISIH